MRNNLSACYYLTRNINAGDTMVSSGSHSWNTPAGFIPIGNSSGGTFTGQFYGEGYYIDRLYINRPTATDYTGLFGVVDGGAIIDGIKITSANITGKEDVGAIAGDSWGSTITNCSVTNSTIKSQNDDYVGGLVGWAWITNFDEITVTNSDVSGDFHVGGVVGYAKKEVDVTNTTIDNLDITGTQNVGGIFGYAEQEITTSNAVISDLVAEGEEDVGGLAGDIIAVAGTHGGVFSSIDVTNATITNVGNSSMRAGGLVGSCWGSSKANLTFDDITTSGTVTGRLEIGGFGGSVQSATITNSSSSMTVMDNDLADQDATRAGGFVGWLDKADVSNSYATGNVTMADGTMVGGFVGWQSTNGDDSIIDGCYATGNVRGSYAAGGFIGSQDSDSMNNIIIRNSYSTGSFNDYDTAPGGIASSYIGGFAGENGGIIDNCYSTGSVTVVDPESYYIGGFTGNYWGSINNSHSTGNVTAFAKTGGFCGRYYGSNPITRSYSTGTVQGTTDVGGFIGISRSNSSDITNNCYTSSPVSGTDAVGGFIGNQNSTSGSGNANYANSYSRGTVSGSSNIGGFMGKNEDGFGVATSCYWDTQTSGRGTSAIGSGKTTAQMKTQATYTGWDFTNIWSFTAGQYPSLR